MARDANYGGGSRSGPEYDKTPVLALICKDTGEARSKVVTDVTGAALRKAIAEGGPQGHRGEAPQD